MIKKSSDGNSLPLEPRPLILMVDDDPAALRLLAAALSGSPFEIETAASGEAALASISHRIPDLVVLDFEMPGQSGVDVCASIRNAETVAVRNLPVIMLTAHTGEADEVRCLEAGANDFVTKPVGAAALEARILTQLRLRSYARKLEEWQKLREADLACARSLQQGLVPQTTPEMTDWEVQARYTPFIEVGGDMYGWESLPDGRVLFWLADGIGHGAAAALITALTAHLFRKASELAVSPSEVLRKVNHDFTKAVSGASFMTACCAIVASDGSAIFSSVGHPPVLVRRQNGTVESFSSEKAMLGMQETMRPDEDAVTLSQGDALLLYTDGLYSFRNKGGEKLTAQTIEDSLRENELGSDMIADLQARVIARSDGAPVFDDLAVIALRRLE